MEAIKKIKGIPSPEERPDLCEDLQQRALLSQEYRDSVWPEHVKKAPTFRSSVAIGGQPTPGSAMAFATARRGLTGVNMTASGVVFARGRHLHGTVDDS